MTYEGNEKTNLVIVTEQECFHSHH
jgi:hypothetical protein